MYLAYFFFPIVFLALLSFPWRRNFVYLVNIKDVLFNLILY